jgi:hypothetical protein
MAPPAKIWSSAACTLAISDRTSARPSIKAAAVSEDFFMKSPFDCGALTMEYQADVP